MTDILVNAANIAGRLQDMQLADTLSMILFGLILVFGLMNCILGYRLLRFWMMLFGFLIGAGIGAFGASQMGITDKTIYIVAMVAAGVILAVIAFAIFKAGIFLIGAGLGLSVTIYVIHPTTSFTFFICLLAGVLKIEHIQEKADFLMENMAFFFVPAGVSVMNYFDILKSTLVPFLIICIVSTIITFAATAYSVQFVMKLMNRRKK